MTGARYRDLLSSRDTFWILWVVNLGRLSSGIIPFGIVAYFTNRNAYAEAGFASSAFMIVTALTAPIKGRIISRHTPRVTLLPMAVAYATMCSVAILCSSYLPFLAVLSLILIGGAIAPPTGAVVRSLWTELAAGNDAVNRSLHSLDSVSEEFTFAIAPVITAGIWEWAGAVWAVPTGGALTVIGTALLLAVGLTGSETVQHVLSEPVKPEPRLPHPLGFKARVALATAAYRSRTAIGLLAPMLGLGAAMGALSIVLPAWSTAHLGGPEFSGILLGVISLSGAITGLLAPKLPVSRLSDVRQYQIAAGIVTVAMIIFSFSETLEVSLMAAIVLGSGMTPMFINAYVLVGKIAARENHTEINAALGSGFNLGDGLTSLAIGVLITATSGAIALGVFAGVVAVLCITATLLPHQSPQDEARDDLLAGRS